MRKILLVVKAEILKQHHNSFHSYFIYFSLLIWPILGFLTVFYSYKPFQLGQNSSTFGVNNEQSLLFFLITGFMAYNCFWSMVQSGWQLGNLERQSGTLELAFLSPANRLAMVYGKALGAFLQNIWMFAIFCIIVLFILGGITWSKILALPLMFIILVIASTVWGGLMNTIFLFSRDSTIIMNIVDDPMVLFSGVRVPVNVFPGWWQTISLVFPLTYCLNIIRELLSSKSWHSITGNLVSLIICLAVMIILTVILLKIAEKNNRESGSLSLF